MEPIRSGTTTERIVRTTILTAMLVGYALWCLWDGYYAYPRKNVQHLKENLTPIPDTPPAINPQVTRSKVVSISGRLRNKEEVTEADVIALLGEPAAREKAAPQGPQAKWFFHFGPGGMAKITIKDGKTVRAKWVDGLKKESDLFTQFLMGGVVGALGLLMLLQWIRAVTTRIELTDGGLKVNSQGGLRFGGSPLIPVEAITSLGTDDYKKKGSVQIHYALADGTEGEVEINDYVHRAFPQVVGEICHQRGWVNPVKGFDEEEAVGEAGAGGPGGLADDDGQHRTDPPDQTDS
jgi:hypothetical protein